MNTTEFQYVLRTNFDHSFFETVNDFLDKHIDDLHCVTLDKGAFGCSYMTTIHDTIEDMLVTKAKLQILLS